MKQTKITYEAFGDTLLIHMPKELDHHNCRDLKRDTDLMLDENYIKGELWQPVKTWKWLWNKKPDQVLPADTLTYNITGKVLYIGTYDHQISQIIFKGAKNTYVYDTTEVRLHMETFLDFYENIPVPLQGMNADNYEIYVMYQDGFYDTQQTFAIN